MISLLFFYLSKLLFKVSFNLYVTLNMTKRTPKLLLPGSLARSLKRISFSGRGRRTETNLNILCMCQPPSQVASQKHLHSGCIGKENFPPGRPGPKNLTKVRMQIIIKLQLAFTSRIQDENDGDPISQKNCI